jgi:hypothetical protein
MTMQLLPSRFLIYEENVVFFFISVAWFGEATKPPKWMIELIFSDKKTLMENKTCGSSGASVYS